MSAPGNQTIVLIVIRQKAKFTNRALKLLFLEGNLKFEQEIWFHYVLVQVIEIFLVLKYLVVFFAFDSSYSFMEFPSAEKPNQDTMALPSADKSKYHGTPLSWQTKPRYHGTPISWQTKPRYHGTPISWQTKSKYHGTPVSWQTKPKYHGTPVTWQTKSKYHGQLLQDEASSTLTKHLWI
jgi:hypothetical protein